MQFLDFTKSSDKRTKELEELKHRVDLGDAVEKMVKSEGWHIVETLFKEQLEAYKADLLLGCKDWEEYRDKRSKAWAMSLLLQDVQDYIDQGKDAAEEIDKLTV